MDSEMECYATLTVGEDDAIGILVDANLSDEDVLELLWDLYAYKSNTPRYKCPLCSANLSSASMAWTHFRFIHAQDKAPDGEEWTDE